MQLNYIVVLVKRSGREMLPELKDFFPDLWHTDVTLYSDYLFFFFHAIGKYFSPQQCTVASPPPPPPL